MIGSNRSHLIKVGPWREKWDFAPSLSKMVQMSPDWIKWILFSPNMSQTGPGWSKLVLIGQNGSGLVKICTDW